MLWIVPKGKVVERLVPKLQRTESGSALLAHMMVVNLNRHRFDSSRRPLCHAVYLPSTWLPLTVSIKYWP